MSTPLELLAPAGTLEIGKAAIDHGADAVYIGAPKFSARAQAGRTIEEIAELIRYAHFFHVRVYVALNTILSDEEIPQVHQLIREMDEIGADALIVQDMGLLELDLPPIPLIASTQTNNTTPEKVKFLESVGFQRVILARELSLKEIAAIRATTSVELEAFVHGALCVCYSGQCYMSHFTSGRSANKGVCAQPCRHTYTLKDGDGKTILRDKHLLSLKDMKRLDAIGDLVAAGITSFKIEGRYKEIDYVKNITAAYRSQIDRYISEHPNTRRASSGRCELNFQPEPERTFNRGYTPYYLKNHREKAASLDTPKSTGQFVGKIDHVGQNYFILRGHDLHNGDGLCFFTKNETLSGCRVDRVEGEKIYPNTLTDLFVGMEIFRNFDTAFSRTLKQSASCRTISIEMEFRQEQNGIRLKIKDEDGIEVEHWKDIPFEPAKDQDRAQKNIEKQLARTGDTAFRVERLALHPKQPGFIALSILNDLRRKTLDMLACARMEQVRRKSAKIVPNSVPYPETELDYRANVSNAYAEKFYRRHGATLLERAWESEGDDAKTSVSERAVMTTRYCILYQLDACPRYGKGKSQKELKPPLRIFDRANVYRLEFQCQECRMSIFPEPGGKSTVDVFRNPELRA